MAERRSFIIASLPLLLSSGRFLNHVLQGHIERYVYIYTYTLRYAEAEQKQSSFSLSFLFEMGVSNKCWLASY
jgi:hypothetical protein